MYQPITNNPAEVEFYKTYFDVKPFYQCGNISEEYIHNEVDIYLITFNNPWLVEYQIKTLNKFFKAPFNLIVVDNNCGLHPESSAKVFEICQRECVIYLKAPDNYYQFNFDPSMKLGTTMNWIYLNCVLLRKPKYFGFLDHDCFLVENFDIRPYLDENGMYGRPNYSTICEAWNLHVTANFFRLDFVEGYDLDFRPSHKYQLDTGGNNFDIIYNHFDPKDYELPRQTPRFLDEDINRKDSVQHYELMHVWFHLCASSHDQLVGDGKEKLIYAKGFLDSRLLL